MKPNGLNWRHGRARLDLSAEEAAARLRIKPNSLRNIESNQPNYTVSDRLTYRAAALYDVTFDDLVVQEDEKPEEPKPEPAKPAKERQRDPSSPPPRQNGKSNRRGPRRSTDLKAAS